MNSRDSDSGCLTTQLHINIPKYKHLEVHNTLVPLSISDTGQYTVSKQTNLSFELNKLFLAWNVVVPGCGPAKAARLAKVAQEQLFLS